MVDFIVGLFNNANSEPLYMKSAAISARRNCFITGVPIVLLFPEVSDLTAIASRDQLLIVLLKPREFSANKQLFPGITTPNFHPDRFRPVTRKFTPRSVNP